MLSPTIHDRRIARAATQPNPAAALLTLVSQPEWPPDEDVVGRIASKLNGGLWLTQMIDTLSLREIHERLERLEKTYGMLADIEPDPTRAEALRMAESEAHALGVLIGAGTLAAKASRKRPS